MKYSIAIRTLGTNAETLRKELISIHAQSLPPERIIIYIAEGYSKPDFRIGKEEYVWVKKGMLAQRALEYNEIPEEYILTLDDDVELSSTFAETLLTEMIQHNADVVGADVFKNHKLSILQKASAFISNLVRPHFSSEYAFKVHKHGSFSYVYEPQKSYYLTQSCPGPAILWKKQILTSIKLKDEIWLDKLPFAYGEDQVATFKAHQNGYRLGISFDAGIINLDGQSSSNKYRKSPERFITRTKAMFIAWWRTQYKPYGNNYNGDITTLFWGIVKATWLFCIFSLISATNFNSHFIKSYLIGLKEGYRFVTSDEYSYIPSFILPKSAN
ncbi:MAG: hypothetical protein HFJ95_01770 [Muribaculaceae bacterium]|nr:hypothetical protein [Muribaculaceae bacterium]